MKDHLSLSVLLITFTHFLNVKTLKVTAVRLVFFIIYNTIIIYYL